MTEITADTLKERLLQEAEKRRQEREEETRKRIYALSEAFKS